MTALIVAALIIVAVVAVIVYRYFAFLTKDDPEALCRMAKDRNMACVQLAAPGVYDHGAIIRSTQPIDAKAPLGLPTDYVFSDRCAYTPASIAFSKYHESPEQAVNFGSHVFHFDRTLSAGASLALPKIAGLTLTAGPNLSEIRSVTLEADSAQYFTIDTRSFMDALSSCSVRPSCSSMLKAPGSRAIKSLLVAKNLKYRVETKSGESESLVAALKAKSISVGVESSGNTASVDDLSSGKDMVFAVGFFEPSEIQEIPSCSEPLTILKVTGKTTAHSASGVAGRAVDHKEGDAGGKEISTISTAPDAPDRGNESMIDPEARAWGVWNYNDVKREVGLFARTFVEPGTRAENGPGLKEVPGSLRVWAVPHSSLDNQVEVTLENSLNETKVLYATANIQVNTSMSLMGKTAMYSYFQPLTFVSQDGTEHQVPSVWRGGENIKNFELGRVRPGEVVKVRIGRKLEATARSKDEAGATQEDILITFSLK